VRGVEQQRPAVREPADVDAARQSLNASAASTAGGGTAVPRASSVSRTPSATAALPR